MTKPSYWSRDRGQDSEEEKPLPRKGETRIPRKRLHKHAMLEMGYPFKEDDDSFIIQKALSPEQIDDFMVVSAEFRRWPASGEYIGSEEETLRQMARERDSVRDT